ncbi:zf-DHHC-domain-containing protein [Pseudovirgaria hyperparasitica]|uniref:Palmitoyltransferase n=1 Tax=Pseudovirgaria hyperparasitica TaxID=470096 RepID=A0A6A6WC59_9PEZI|nr:zf-DHHC-domain-containing protein [Pseudovirgaria hyperparasitica]KAF2760293.1 zf-DHHC-domain-containing protein [Pseudovirgaria hyperparasitica]
MSKLIVGFTGVLVVSFFTFVAFFGRLPAFRGTPVGFLHRLIWIYIPNVLLALDSRLTGGRLTAAGQRSSHYLFNEKHPIIIIFFLGLVTVCALFFIPQVWPSIPTKHHYILPLALPWPYYFTYLCARVRGGSHITNENHAKHMQLYPYDRIIYNPGQRCTTCKWYKPARSKHCSFCNTCVARCDHHCVWVNNCLGRSNYRWFLALLLFTGLLLVYATYLTWLVIAPRTRDAMQHVKWSTPHSASLMDAWAARFSNFGRIVDIGITCGGPSISGIGLLALFTSPMPFGLLLFHIYLIWAGTTTNETSKWALLRENMWEGSVFIAQRKVPGKPPTERDSPYQNWELETDWPVRCRQVVVRTRDGQTPVNVPKEMSRVIDETSWKRGWSLAEVENVYDLGFWDNFIEALT